MSPVCPARSLPGQPCWAAGGSGAWAGRLPGAALLAGRAVRRRQHLALGRGRHAVAAAGADEWQCGLGRRRGRVSGLRRGQLS